MTKAPSSDAPPAAAAPTCRCELTIPAAILEGYSCGRPDCWRAAPVQASFDAFVADLVRRRDGARDETEAAPQG